MRARADPDVIAEHPVVEIVAGFLPRPTECRNLVTQKTSGIEQRQARRFDLRKRVFVGERRRVQREFGARFDRELVPRNVRDTERNGTLEVRRRGLRRLPGQTMHQIEVDAVEAGLQRG